ncbi:hypothetical protein [Streptomyces sp. NBC_00233]|uniref:hypothetical protein n=1 Tax=Streptomyces sp. NBC_00233 TaxID=2975686 RepID=UPI00224E20A6|nr:hypothetical protein [Streptomyces sp. NBC_00233]MCX5232308.1 hypothetical protein [Streptomyces sp. NBC_00233]
MSAHHVRAVLLAAERRGVATAPLLARAGLLSALVEEPRTPERASVRVPAERFGARRPHGSTGSVRVLRMGFADGMLNGLCLSRRQEIAGATYTLLLTLGDDDPGSWENTDGADVKTVKDASGAYAVKPAEQSAAPLRHPGAVRQVRPDRRHRPGRPDPGPPHHTEARSPYDRAPPPAPPRRRPPGHPAPRDSRTASPSAGVRI